MEQDFNNEEINFFAKTNFRNRERVFGIKTDDRRRHMYVVGKTGMGKTNLIQNMAINDIRSGKGVGIVDPHGEFAERCLEAVPSNRINDVIYFNPADTDFPIAMNVMEKVDAEYRHLVASGLVGVFKKIWADSWGPRLEYLLRNAILALLEYPTSTLLGVTRILIDKTYREKVVEKVTDPVVRSFWTEEFTKYHDRLMAEAIAPIQNKVGQFLSSALIRNIVGQTKSAFSVREAMDNQKILIMNLSKGRIGEDNSALLGAMMITKIQLAAMARVDVSEEERKDFYLYVDEFQNFATESFSNILSEARKYRLNLILAHQYIAQLDEKVQDAIFGNVGTLIAFRVGAMDAEVLEKEFAPVFYLNDLVNLTKYHIYLKLMIDGVAASPFSATVLPPIDVSDTAANAVKVVNVSRERYGSQREKVEDKISRWSGIVNPETKKNLEKLALKQAVRHKEKKKVLNKKTADFQLSTEEESKSKVSNQENKEAVSANMAKMATEPMTKSEQLKVSTEEENHLQKEKAEKKLFPAECSACGIETKVPFQPDGERPVFCKDCLREYRRQQAKLRQQLQANEKKATNEKQSPSQAFNQQPKESKKYQSRSSQTSLKELINKALKERQ